MGHLYGLFGGGYGFGLAAGSGQHVRKPLSTLPTPPAGNSPSPARPPRLPEAG